MSCMRFGWIMSTVALVIPPCCHVTTEASGCITVTTRRMWLLYAVVLANPIQAVRKNWIPIYHISTPPPPSATTMTVVVTGVIVPAAILLGICVTISVVVCIYSNDRRKRLRRPPLAPKPTVNAPGSPLQATPPQVVPPSHEQKQDKLPFSTPQQAPPPTMYNEQPPSYSAKQDPPSYPPPQNALPGADYPPQMPGTVPYPS